MRGRVVRLLSSGVITIVIGVILNFLISPDWNQFEEMWGFLLFVGTIGTIVSAIIDFVLEEDFINTGIYAGVPAICIIVLALHNQLMIGV